MNITMIKLSALTFFLITQISTPLYAASSLPASCYNADQTIKKINVHYEVTQDTSGSPIKVDASASTVPSGEIEYLWDVYLGGQFKSDAPKTAILVLKDLEAKAGRMVDLTVRDKVCKNREVANIQVISK